MFINVPNFGKISNSLKNVESNKQNWTHKENGDRLIDREQDDN